MRTALLLSVCGVILMTDLVSARSFKSLSAASNNRMSLAEGREELSELSRKKKKKGSGESGSGSGSSESGSGSASSESGGKSGSKECSCPSGSGTSSGTPIRSETVSERKKKKKSKKGKKSSEECSCEETATEIGVITAAPTEITAAPTRSSVI